MNCLNWVLCNRRFLIVGLLCISRYGFAADFDFKLRGFATLGAARSTDESAEYVRDLSQAHGLNNHWRMENDSVFGLQANVMLQRRLEFIAQVVSRYRPKTNFEPEVTWAFLRYTPNPNWTGRLGRLGTEFYMLADSRMVGYSYNAVRPPIDYYGTLPFTYFDGADIGFSYPMLQGIFSAKLYSGFSQELSPWGSLQYDMSDSLLVGGYVDFYRAPWQIRFGQARLRFKRDLPVEDFYSLLPARTADELRVADRWTYFTSLGIAYDAGPLRVQTMLSHTDNNHGTFQDTWAGYLIASYRLRDALSPFVGFSMAYSDAKTLQYPVLPYTDSYQANFHTNQKTVFTGIRWDFRSNMCLKGQVDLIRGTPESKFLYRNETADWDGSMAVFTVTWDMIF
jgi:hypothetical protein